MRWFGVALAAGAFALPATLTAQTQETGFLDRVVTVDGADRRYQVYLPNSYDAQAEWPVILFLHGGGAQGEDGLKSTQIGLGAAIRLTPERWPAIAVFPQTPEGKDWLGLGGRIAMAALAATLDEFSGDRSRVYLTGLSMGGKGAWYLGSEHPDRFAAMVVIAGCAACGRPPPGGFPKSREDLIGDLAARLFDVPVWIFHGDADSVVPVGGSRNMEAALQAVGATVRYTEFPDVEHNSWMHAYFLEELPVWLFAQRNR